MWRAKHCVSFYWFHYISFIHSSPFPFLPFHPRLICPLDLFLFLPFSYASFKHFAGLRTDRRLVLYCFFSSHTRKKKHKNREKNLSKRVQRDCKQCWLAFCVAVRKLFGSASCSFFFFLLFFRLSSLVRLSCALLPPSSPHQTSYQAVQFEDYSASRIRSNRSDV